MYSKSYNKGAFAVFGTITKKIKADNLQQTLIALNEKTNAQEFLASSIMSAVLFLAIVLCLFLVISKNTLLFELNSTVLLFNGLASLIAASIFFLILYELPFIEYTNRKHEMNKELAKETIHLSLLGKNISKLKDFLIIISRFDESPELKKFAEFVLKQSNKGNEEIALKQELEKVSSKRVKNFFSGLYSLIKAKATEKQIRQLIENELEKGKEESEIKRERNLGEALLLIQALVVITVLAIILIILTFTNKALDMNILSSIIFIGLPIIFTITVIVIELNTEKVD